ncbi:C2H2 finger domain protein, putative, partial [Aspergillus udagawae]
QPWHRFANLQFEVTDLSLLLSYLYQRGFTNPTPKTESARSALSSFTCTLCNKSYSRHPEYEAHISSYDHQHRKRLQDLKQLSRDPNAAEKARRAEKKADAEAGLRVIGTTPASGAGGAIGTSGGGGFKKGGFKSSFTTVKGPVSTTVSTRKNVLGDDDDDDADQAVGAGESSELVRNRPRQDTDTQHENAESDTDEEYTNDDTGASYYDPRKPTDCSLRCPGFQHELPIA